MKRSFFLFFFLMLVAGFVIGYAYLGVDREFLVGVGIIYFCTSLYGLVHYTNKCILWSFKKYGDKDNHKEAGP